MYEILGKMHRDRSKHRESKHEKMRDKILGRLQLLLNPNFMAHHEIHDVFIPLQAKRVGRLLKMGI